MTSDEQAASSIRYIAPRVVLLDSGLYALIDMLGDNPPAILNAEALLFAIPTESELCIEYDSRQASSSMTRVLPEPKPSTATLTSVMDIL